MADSSFSHKVKSRLGLNFPIWIIPASIMFIYILTAFGKNVSPVSGIMAFFVVYRLIKTFPLSEWVVEKKYKPKEIKRTPDLMLSTYREQEVIVADDPMDYYSRRKQLELTIARFQSLREEALERKKATVQTGELKDCIIEEEQLILYYPNGRIENHFWCEFHYYVIANQTLFLFKSDLDPALVLNKKKTGVFFDPIFLAVMEHVNHI